MRKSCAIHRILQFSLRCPVNTDMVAAAKAAVDTWCRDAGDDTKVHKPLKGSVAETGEKV